MSHGRTLPAVSVIVATHNPDATRLTSAMDGLRRQTLPPSEWELLIVDNASQPRIEAGDIDLTWHGNARLISEPHLGLTAARRTGLAESAGDVIVLVDDDNVLAKDYLQQALCILKSHTTLGAIGGRSVGKFDAPLQHWHEEFLDLLAVRDLGDHVITSDDIHEPYPRCAPIGAGMVLRRQAILDWLTENPDRLPPDRQGRQLTSGGDNDIVLSVLKRGWTVAYRPELTLTHLIPRSRLTARYLGRLNYAIQRSWVEVLARHERCPWRRIPRWTLPLRAARAALRRKVGSGSAAFIRWCGDCGRFAAQASLPPS